MEINLTLFCKIFFALPCTVIPFLELYLVQLLKLAYECLGAGFWGCCSLSPPVGAVLARFLFCFKNLPQLSSLGEGNGDIASAGRAGGWFPRPREWRWPVQEKATKLGPLSFPPGSGWGQEGLNLFLFMSCSSIHLQKQMLHVGPRLPAVRPYSCHNQSGKSIYTYRKHLQYTLPRKKLNCGFSEKFTNI